MKKYFAYAATILTVFIARVIPFTFLVGSCSAWFSWSTMIAPVVGKRVCLRWLALFLIPIKIVSMSMLLLHIVRRLPLLAAALVYRNKNIVSWVLLPLVCMMLFMIHPVGSQAWPYALYWVIPMILWLLDDSIWSYALSASFVAHAIGSVIWLYTGNIDASIWNGLIPVVAVERLCMAFGMIAIDLSVVVFGFAVGKIKQRLLVADAV